MSPTLSLRLLAALGAVSVLTPIGVSAQSAGPGDLTQGRSGNVAFHRFAEPGDYVIHVNVWGAVRSSGLYEIPEGTHLNTLLTLAGGPQLGGASGRTRRQLTLQLLRPNGAGYDLVARSNMQDEIVVSNENPVLEEGDYLVVHLEERQRFGWRDALSVVTAAAALALAVDRVFRAFR